jgi:endo-1,4-beta-D-glucanase Y
VIDADRASDADVLAAYALLRYDGPDAEQLHDDGETLAHAVLEYELRQDAEGQPVLAAGPWAVEPGIVNPSYLMASVFTDLADLTGDDTCGQRSRTRR